MARLRLREGWLSLIFLSLSVLSVAWSVRQAGWAGELSVLVPVSIAGLGVGLVLAKWKRPPRALRHLAGLVVGVAVVFYEMHTVLGPEPAGYLDRIREILVRMGSWIDVALHGGISDDALIFSLILAALFWLLSYCSAWFIFRSHWFWPALIPWGVILVVNMGYSPPTLTPFFVLFLLSSLLLGVRFTFFVREQRWRNAGIQYTRGVFWRFLWLGGTLSTAVVLLAWVVPPTAGGRALDISSHFGEPWQQIQDEWMRVFGSLSGAGNASFSSFGQNFNIGGARRLSNRVALTVKASEGAYLQAVAYDTYDGHGWANSDESAFRPPTDRPNLTPRISLPANTPIATTDLLREPFTQTVTIVQPRGRVLFVASQPISVSQPVTLLLPRSDVPRRIEISPQGEQNAPAELKPLVHLLLVARQGLEPGQTGGGGDVMPPIMAEMRRLRDLGLSISYNPSSTNAGLGNRRDFDSTTDPTPTPSADPRPAGGGYLRVSGQIPRYGEIDAIYSQGPVAGGDTYTVVSSVSVADEDSLRKAPTNYPQWVTDMQLQLPPNMPSRIRDLALALTQEKQNPYDKAKAIEGYLRTLTYNDSAPPAPHDRDTVDYFLFDSKQGYCEHFASAMVVMLRSIGMPTRLVSGFAPGAYDAQQSAYVVRESAAHTWPEVYFPQYGWIPFEPTPSRTLLSRPGQAAGDNPATQEQIPANPPENKSPGLPDIGVRPIGGEPSSLLKPHSNDSFSPWLTIAGGILAALLLGASALYFLWRRGLRGLSQASTVYAKMQRASAWLGLAPAGQPTPFESAAHLGAAIPSTNRLTRHIAESYVAENFGRRQLDQQQSRELRESWETLRGAFWRFVFGRYLKVKIRRGQR